MSNRGEFGSSFFDVFRQTKSMNLALFKMDKQGMLLPIETGIYPVLGRSSYPADVQFSPNGNYVLLSSRALTGIGRFLPLAIAILARLGFVNVFKVIDDTLEEVSGA